MNTKAIINQIKENCTAKGAVELEKEDWQTIINTLEKQIPVQPRIIYGQKVNYNIGRLMSFYCPKCGKFQFGIYENDVGKGEGVSCEYTGCSKCLQAIDVERYRI